MVDEADACKEITVAMVKRRCRFKCCDKILLNALHKRGYWFRGLRKKMILTPDDVKERYAWSKKYKGKTREWWKKKVHIHLDNHHFKAATTCGGRRLMAKRRVRGVYRRKQKSLRSGHVKPDPKLRLNTGTKGFLKICGIGGGKVLVLSTIKGAWSGDQAAHYYTKVIKPALQKRYPNRRRFTILEDNDPTGNVSKKGVAAKARCNLDVLKIPKRSPDLNVCDYALWSEVEKRLRLQERKMPAGKKETREQFERRLDRTLRSLPQAFIDNSIGNLQERCQKLYDAEGGLFEEGGRSKRPL